MLGSSPSGDAWPSPNPPDSSETPALAGPVPHQSDEDSRDACGGNPEPSSNSQIPGSAGPTTTAAETSDYPSALGNPASSTFQLERATESTQNVLLFTRASQPFSQPPPGNSATAPGSAAGPESTADSESVAASESTAMGSAPPSAASSGPDDRLGALGSDQPRLHSVDILELLIAQGLAAQQRAQQQQRAADGEQPEPANTPHFFRLASPLFATNFRNAASPPAQASGESSRTSGASDPARGSTTPATGLADDIGAIVITINYAFANDDLPNPNRTGSLTISVPNTTFNRNTHTIHDFVSFATRLAYQELFSNVKTGITREKFESFEAVPVDKLTDSVCSICFEPYDGLQSLQEVAKSLALKRRKLSPDEHSVSMSESEDDRLERSRSLTPEIPAPTANTETTSGSATGTGATRSTGPEYLCDQDKEFSHDVIKLPCSHIFGKSCLAHWLKTASTCPLCRFNVNSPSEESGEGTGERPQEFGQNFSYLFLGNWMRNAADQAQPPTGAPSPDQPPNANQALPVNRAEEASGIIFTTLTPQLSRTSSSASVPSLYSSAPADIASGAENSDRRARRFEFLRSFTHSIFRRPRRPEAPSPPLVLLETERNAPPAMGPAEPPADGSDRDRFESLSFRARNPTFSPVIEGIFNYLSTTDGRDESSIFASGVSSRRTAGGFETTTTAGVARRPESVIIISPNSFVTRIAQPDTSATRETDSNIS
ncbi:hypothetical protein METBISCDRAFT_23798 [Metschnikowia bicuspidata]|uniref:RING-type domain-containing protein n=1 Tax=Metschnikowia bicuspidata TaxID=27322 RepID=A0A4P9ZCR6_9ASCO|nr:hypothetical protein METBISCDRAFT_23798 [Metschnikowia bicuspidata]